jgi:copper chaperone
MLSLYCSDHLKRKSIMADIYRVEGMTCDGCARAVTNAIKARAPGATVHVDLKRGQVQVEGGPDQAKVAAAVEDAGFEFAGRV